jgi:hypothetical protein
MPEGGTCFAISWQNEPIIGITGFSADIVHLGMFGCSLMDTDAEGRAGA